MSNGVKPIKVMILDKEFLVACPEDEQAALLASADYLNGKMKEVQRNGRVIGMDRITIMTALNMANDLLQQQDRGNDIDPSLSKRLHLIQDKVDTAMRKNQQVEF